MRFLENGPDVPDDLIRTQLSGEMLFVVGAGVSKRVGLPLFGGLTQSVYEAIGQAPPNLPHTLADVAEKEAWGRSEWDRILGLLEKRIVYPSPNLPEVTNPIRLAVGDILQARSRDLDPYKNILTISADANGRPRVVTTNFDTLFERAWRRMKTERPRTFTGPGLPAVGSPEFHGIIHLHGRIHDKSLGLPASELVLTSADFGEAYLRSGWASRFVYDLLRRYTLVFVGYAADDPPMRYMLEATEAGRLKFPDLHRAFAFADVSPTDNEGNVRARWRAKGLEPIVFQNEDNTFDHLFATLSEWATFAADPKAWADQQISTIAATRYVEASDEARNQVQFLVDTVSDIETLSKHAKSPDWIETRIKKTPQLELPFRDAVVWLTHWASTVETAKWSMTPAAQPVATTVAEAASRVLEFIKPAPDSLLNQFWKIYFLAHCNQLGIPARGNWLTLQKQLKAGEADYFAISGVVRVVQPVLRLRDSWSRLLRDKEKDNDEVRSLYDLCRIEYECEQWPKIGDILSAYPDDAASASRLLATLTGVLGIICGLAQDIGSISDDGDAVSRDVRLVHLPSAAEIAPAIAEWSQSSGTPNHQDDYNHSFAPISRLMSGVWLRLSKKDKRVAASIAKSWVGHGALLIRRLGYWAASIVDHGLVADADVFLRGLNRKQFWRRELTAEAARFWCSRWDQLSSETRANLEHLMRQGPQLNWIWSGTKSRQRHDIIDSMVHRELRRVATAGGKLSRSSKAKMRQLEIKHHDHRKSVALYEGLYSVSWSSFGPTGDPTSVASAPVATLLDQVDAAIVADPFRQRDLWSIICRERPADAFAALKNASADGNWPTEKWRGVINQLVTNAEKTTAAQIGEVLRVLLAMPTAVLAELLASVCQWFSWSSKKCTSRVMRRTALRLWDRIADITEAIPDDPNKQRSGRDLANDSLGEPAGQLADIIANFQGASPRKAGLGIATDLQPRFDRLMALQNRQKIFALARLIQSLAFYSWLAPEWTEQHLFTALDSDTSDAKELLETLVLYGSYNQIKVVSRLKARIFAAVLSDNISHDAQERLASLVTWMTIRRLSGRTDVEVTETEARELLTRAPSGALRSIAWSLWRDLSGVKIRSRKVHWNRYIKPFLEKVWPNDISTRDAAISENLARIPGVTAGAFPDAVRVIDNLIVPFKTFSVCTGLGVDENSQLLTRYAGDVLELAIASIDLTAPPPYDLQKFLDDLSAKKPTLKNDVRFQKLNALLHGG